MGPGGGGGCGGGSPRVCVCARERTTKEGGRFTHYDQGPKGGGADGGRERATFPVDSWMYEETLVPCWVVAGVGSAASAVLSGNVL